MFHKASEQSEGPSPVSVSPGKFFSISTFVDETEHSMFSAALSLNGSGHIEPKGLCCPLLIRSLMTGPHTDVVFSPSDQWWSLFQVLVEACGQFV